MARSENYKPSLTVSLPEELIDMVVAEAKKKYPTRRNSGRSRHALSSKSTEGYPTRLGKILRLVSGMSSGLTT